MQGNESSQEMPDGWAREIPIGDYGQEPSVPRYMDQLKPNGKLPWRTATGRFFREGRPEVQQRAASIAWFGLQKFVMKHKVGVALASAVTELTPVGWVLEPGPITEITVGTLAVAGVTAAREISRLRDPSYPPSEN